MGTERVSQRLRLRSYLTKNIQKPCRAERFQVHWTTVTRTILVLGFMSKSHTYRQHPNENYTYVKSDFMFDEIIYEMIPPGNQTLSTLQKLTLCKNLPRSSSKVATRNFTSPPPPTYSPDPPLQTSVCFDLSSIRFLDNQGK